MNWLDIVILALLGLAGLAGWRMGLIRGGCLVLGVIAGIVLAGRFGDGLGEALVFVENPRGASILGFVVIFGLTLVASTIAGGILRGVARLSMLGRVDNVGGAVLGAPVGAFLLTLALVLGGSLSVGGLNTTIHESRLAAFLTDNVPSALDRLPEEFRDVLSYVTKEVQRPQATLANIGIIEASSTRVKFRVDVALTNPNPFRGTVQRAEYRLLWDRGGQQLLLGETKEVELHRLKTKGTTEVSVAPLVLERAQTPIVGELGQQLLAGSSVPVTAQGRLTIAFRSETVEVPFQGTKLAQRAKEG